MEQALQQLIDQKVEAVPMSDWAAPIVPPDGSIRICGDYKVTINKATKQDVYLPRVENLFTTLAGGKSFTKLDLAHAYAQIPLDSRQNSTLPLIPIKHCLDTTNCHLVCQQHPLSSKEQCMEGLLQGTPNVSIYLNDILVTCRDI